MTNHNPATQPSADPARQPSEDPADQGSFVDLYGHIVQGVFSNPSLVTIDAEGCAHLNCTPESLAHVIDQVVTAVFA